MGADMAEPPVDPMALEPTDAELDAWAERERKRREAWLKGPTADERAAYARRVRERRLMELEARTPSAIGPARWSTTRAKSSWPWKAR